MTDKEKLIKIKKLADAMYVKMQNLTTDTSGIRKAMEEYHQFVILEYDKEEPVSEDLKEAAQKYADLRMSNYGIAFYAFMSGAKWQKEQMMNNTADAMIGLPYENKEGGYTHLIDVSRPLPVGSNKIAIIFKEE